MAQVASKAVGIDLGTTNSAVAVMNPGDTDIIIHEHAMSKAQTTPSCVWKNPQSGELVVGRRALMRVGTLPEPIRSIKRLMGQRTTVPLTGEDDRISPEEVSAAILTEMKQQITEDMAKLNADPLTWVVDRAIVTVPAYFDQPQIEATRRAAEAAGLEVVDLLHEPTAAAAHYCWRTATLDGTFLVYDFGGGTFDVSVVRCQAGAFDVLGISGNNRLGGDDIDAALARRLQEILQAEGWALDLDLGEEEDRLRFGQLKRLAGEAKKALSSDTEYLLRNDGMVKDKLGNPVVIEIMLERPDLEAAARPFVERTLVYCDEAIDRAGRLGITLADVDQIILAGGSTHMPLVRDMVTAELCSSAGEPAHRPARARCGAPVYEKVDTVVACGAAIRAAAVGGLSIQDTERNVRVSFRGIASTDAATTHVGGTVEALDPAVDLGEGYVRLTVAEHEDEADLGDGGAFSFRGVPLQTQAENMLAFEVFDRAGEVRAVVGRPVTHRPDARRVERDKGAINNKPIELEVKRDGKQARAELVPALERLPMSAIFTFEHPGGVETVKLPFFQGAKQIKVVEVPVPLSTPRGTPVTLDVQMDERYLLTVRGSIEDRAFEAMIEPAPERSLPDAAEIAELEREFEERLTFLPAGERNTVRIRWTLVRQSFQDALDRSDREQAVHDFEELEDIVAGLAESQAPMDPPKTYFDRIVKDCVQLNAYVAGLPADRGLPHDAEEMTRAIEAQRRHGEAAYAAADQDSYSEAIAQLEGYRGHMANMGARMRPNVSELTDAERTLSGLRSAMELAENVQMQAQRAGRGDLRDEAASIGEEFKDLEPQVQRDPHGVRDKVGGRRARLEQLEKILRPGGEDTGLVVDRGKH